MLETNQQEIDLGKISFGKTYNVQYTITNKFDSILKIAKVYGGCSSCTKASVTKSILAPGESTTVNAAFTPGSKGIQLKHIYVTHMLDEFKVQPDLVLKIKAVVND